MISIQVLSFPVVSSGRLIDGVAGCIVRTGGHFIVVGYHPHFLLNGIPTHFNRANGEPVAIEVYVHLLSDHVKAAMAAGFGLVEMDERVMDDGFIAAKPKWEKYRNRPISFCMVWAIGAGPQQVARPEPVAGQGRPK